MMSLQYLRRDILVFIRDHPGIGHMELIGSMCPTMQIAGFKTLRELIEKGLVRVYYTHTETETPNTRDVKFALTLTTDGRVLAELIA